MKLSMIAPSVVTASGPRATATPPTPASQARSGSIYKNSTHPLKQRSLNSFISTYFPQNIFGDSFNELQTLLTRLLNDPTYHMKLSGNLVSLETSGTRNRSKISDNLTLPTLYNNKEQVPILMRALRSHAPSNTPS